MSSDRPLDRIGRECIAVRMRMLSRAVTALYDEALRPHGLKVSQMNVLVLAHHFGIARPAEVCGILCMDASTLSRNVQRMLDRGWLENVPDEDSRARPFRLTNGGEALLREVVPAWERAQVQAREMLGPAGEAALFRAAGALGPETSMS